MNIRCDYAAYRTWGNIPVAYLYLFDRTLSVGTTSIEVAMSAMRVRVRHMVFRCLGVFMVSTVTPIANIYII